MTSSGAEYVYDGAGLRVRRCLPNCTSPTSRTVYVFSGTKVIAEYDNGAAVGSPTREYIYLGGQLLAKFEAGATTYVHHDHLSARIMTNPSGGIVAQSGHFPFGENWHESGGTNKLKFTSYERDSESGNDYAMFRYNISRFGRFSSPDPLGGSLDEPQSLNLYAYVLNEPVLLTDPLGLAAQQNPCSTGWEAACSESGAEEPIYLLDGIRISKKEAMARLHMGSAAACTEKGGCSSLQGNTLKTNAFAYTIQGIARIDCVVGAGCTSGGIAYYVALYSISYIVTNSAQPGPDSIQPKEDSSWLRARLTLTLAGAMAEQRIGCVLPAFMIGSAGPGLYASGQPVPGMKRFQTPGTSPGPSDISEWLRGTLPQRIPGGQVPTLVGGPGTGYPLSVKWTASAGAAIGRAAPFVGLAATGYGVYKLNECLNYAPE